MDLKLKKLIGDYLEEARMMQVATSRNTQPWICTVYFAYDESWNLYWLSLPSSRHSQEIKENDKVAGTIVLPHTPGDKVRGLQFQGTAEEIVKAESVRRLFPYYGKRLNYMEAAEEIISGKNEHHLYQIKPSLFVLFDEVNFPANSRQELKVFA